MLDQVSHKISVCLARLQHGSWSGRVVIGARAAIAFTCASIAIAGITSADGTSAAEPSLAYRRVFVPADNPAAWPRGDDKFLPVETHDFDSWIADANRPIGIARIVDAEYQARLEGEQLVDGQGRWKIELSGQSPALMPLNGISLVVGAAHWQKDTDRPAQLGWWARAVGQLPVRGLQVKRSGELEFSWHTLRAESSADDLDFPLALPNAVTAHLTLDLPETMVPTLDGSVTVESPEKSADTSTPTSVTHGLREPAIKWRRWYWALGPSSIHRLHIAPQAGNRLSNTPTATVSKDIRYHVTNEGLEIQARLRLDARGRELQQLTLSLPAGAKIISVAANDQETSWHLIDTPEGGATRVAIPLPKQLSKGEISIVLVAWDQSKLGQPWPMPTVHVENAAWSSGKIDLQLDDDFKLIAITPTGCSQSHVTQSDSPNERTTTLEFQSYLPNSTVEAQIDRREPAVNAQMGTSLQVGGQTISGRLVTRLQVERGRLSSVRATLEPGWTVVALETIPAESLGQWHVDGNDGPRQLEIELNRAVVASNPISIIATIERRNSKPLDSLSHGFLELLHWHQLRVERNLVQLQMSGRYGLKLTSGFSTFPVDDMADDDRQLFTTPIEGRLIDLNASPPDAAVGLVPTTGVYDVDVDIYATLHGEQLQQTYHVLCQPRGSGIDQVMVYFSEPLSAGPKWEDADTHEVILAKRQPESDPRLAGLPPGGELWSLFLGRLYDRPISLETNISTALKERRPISLLSLPDAGVQRGRVTVRAVNGVAPAVAVQAMSAAPLPVETRDETRKGTMARICEIYRYEPVGFYQASAVPRLWLGLAVESSSGLSGVARRAHIESFFAADGSGVHRIVYHLENSMATNIAWSLPSDVRLETVNLNGRPISLASIAAADGAYRLPLSESSEGGLLTMELRTTGAPLAQGGLISPPLPKSNWTVLAGDWSIWLPAEFAAADEGVNANPYSFDWRHRLLGPWSWFGRRDVAMPTQSMPVDSAPLNTIGWRSIHTTFSIVAPEPIEIVDRDRAITASFWILILAFLATSLFKIPTKLLTLFAPAAATMALLLPTSIAPLAGSAFWGMLFGPLCRRAYSKLVSKPAAYRQFSRPPRVVLAALAFVAALICMQTNARGQQYSTHTATGDASAIHRVLVPIDSHGQPAGTKQFVDEELLRQLLTKTSTSQSNMGRWLLSNLKCEGKLRRQSDQRSAETSSWKMTLDVETFARDSLLDLPLEKSQAVWPAVASLDGIPTPIVWNPNRIGCEIKVSEPGRHQLAIHLEPIKLAPNGAQRIELDVPPVTGAALYMTYPASGMAVELRGGQFNEHAGADGTKEVAGELDGLGKFSIEWSEQTGSGDTSAAMAVDELSWLRIQREGADLQVKYILPGNISLDSFIVVADSSLELCHDETDTSTTKIETLSDGKQSIRVAAPAESDESHFVTLRFHLRNGLLPGQLQIPHFGMTSLPVANRRLAISVDPTWDSEAVNGAVISSGTSAAADFVTAWGRSDFGPPQFVANLSECRPGWYLGVRPRVAESKSDERLSIVAARDHLQMHYDAYVQPQGAHRFGWSLSVPESLTIDTVSLERDGQPATIEYARATPDRVNVFFTEVVDNSFHLSLSGSVPVVASGDCPLPRIATSDPPAVRQIVTVFRQKDVSVTPRNLADAEPLETAAEDASDTGGRQLVGTYEINRTKPNESRLLVEPESVDRGKSNPDTKAPLEPLRKHREDKSQPSIRLVETTMRVASSGGWIITTRMFIAPHGLTQCVLQLPDEQRLVEVKLDGQAALVHPVDDRNWRVQLGPPTLPQTLEIVARGLHCLDPTARFVTLARPVLRNGDVAISAEMSLWSISSSERAVFPRASGAAPVSPLEGAVLRLDRLTSIVESATQLAKDDSDEDEANWLVPRVYELRTAQNTVQTMSIQETSNGTVPARVHAEDDPASLAVARSAKWLAGVEVRAAAMQVGKSKPVDATSDLWDTLPDDQLLEHETVSFASENGENQLTVERASFGMTGGESRAVLLTVVVSVAGIAYWLVGRNRVEA